MADRHDSELGSVLDFDGFPGRWEILESTEETDGAYLRTRMELDEQSELPVHVHPSAEETYEVLAGELAVYVDGEWSTLATGEKRVIAAGTAHSFRNTGPAEVINVHRPALRFEEFFRRFHALKTQHDVPMPPDGLRSAILLAMLLVEYEDEQRTVRPPHWLFKALAGVGRVLGYRVPTVRHAG